MGFIDPLRPEVVAAVDDCRAAGVDVVMVTGDHPATALAISRELHIAAGSDDVITGDELDKLGDADRPEYREAVNRHHVFARVTPIQKLHIVAGVEEGRYAYDNIRKVIYLLISTGAAEVLLFVLAILSGMPLPLFAVQILWLNLVTNGIQDVALAFEGGEPGAMRRPPRRPDEGLFNQLMVQQVAVAGLTMGLIAFGAWVYLIHAGWEESAARNLLLLLFVLLQNVHVFNCRSEYASAFRVPLKRNYILVGGVLAAQGLHILAMHLPFMQSILRVEPTSLREWAGLLMPALAMLVVMEIFKAVRKRVYERNGEPASG